MPRKKEEKINMGLLSRFFEPRKEFMEETRVLFLSRLEFKSKKGETILNHNNIFVFTPFLRYALVAVFIVLFLSGGLVIYADSNNVGPNNPFYGLKKTGEKMRLAMAPKERRPMVDHQIAQRRIEEMQKLKNMDKDMIEMLSNEYKNNINLSLDEMSNLNKEMLDQIKELCAKIAQTMADKIEIVKASNVDDPISDHFKEHCSQFIAMPLIPTK